MDRSSALGLTERVGAVGQLFSSLEHLCRRRDREPGGLNNWQVCRDNFPTRFRLLRSFYDLVGKPRVTEAIHVVRIGAALVLLSPARGRARGLANLTLSTSALLLYPRHLYGTDGTDQVSFLVQVSMTVARLGERRPQLVDACLWFVATQAVLSYTASGWAKLAGVSWRTGRALPAVMRTRTYGDPTAWRLMERYPRVTKAVGAGVLALECLFPIAYLANGRLAKPMVASAAIFHLVNARLMGLGRFVWAFGSMEPAILYTSGPRARWHPDGSPDTPRDDLLPGLCAALAVTALVSALGAQAHRSSRVRRLRDRERLVAVSSGNVLGYRLIGPSDEKLPIVVLEHAMSASAEHWEWIARRISQEYPTLVYNRAGYGRSWYAGNEPYRLEASVKDLLDLIKEVANGRPVVLVGHSLGGHLAWRAANELAGQLQGLGLIDSSHPGQLKRSRRQAQGENVITSSIALMPASLKLGLGALLSRPTWVDRLPEDIREISLAQYRDPGLWQAGYREWQAAREEFHGFAGELAPIGAPLLVMTAGQTALSDPVQKELHSELTQYAPYAEHHVIEGADHDQIVTDFEVAERVGALITQFVDRTRRSADG